ncbi:MAG: NYN domain-containing protein [Halothece sp.]
MTYDESAIYSVSHCVYEAVCSIYQFHPQWLIEKYRRYDWFSDALKTQFVTQLTHKISSVTDTEMLVMTVVKTLRLLLLPDFFVSAEFVRLLDEIRSYTESSPIVTSENAEEGAIAILLLDIENLQLTRETEEFLSKLCTYPIQIKIAFGNWRSLGKKDIEFHNRGYELIHVPPGKDSADVKMATVGSSIFVHYPTAKEVLVCSSDGVMTHLCTTLKTLGLTVHLVRKQGNRITISNQNTGNSTTHLLASSIPSIEEAIAQLKEVIREEQSKNSTYWVKFINIAQAYFKKYSLEIKDIVAYHFPEKQEVDLFLEAKSDFVIHQLGETYEEFYLALFDIHGYPNTVINEISSTQNHKTLVVKTSFQSKLELETALGELSGRLIQQSKTGSVLATHLATEFNKKYGQPITEAIRSLKLTQKYILFLQTCQGLKVHKNGKEYHIKLCNSKEHSESCKKQFQSKEEVEKALGEILIELTKKSQTKTILINDLATAFCQQYKQSINQVIRQLKLGKKYLDFLQSCPKFVVSQVERTYSVEFANPD